MTSSVTVPTPRSPDKEASLPRSPVRLTLFTHSADAPRPYRLRSWVFAVDERRSAYRQTAVYQIWQITDGCRVKCHGSSSVYTFRCLLMLCRLSHVHGQRTCLRGMIRETSRPEASKHVVIEACSV